MDPGSGGKWVGAEEQGGNTGSRYLGGAHRGWCAWIPVCSHMAAGTGMEIGARALKGIRGYGLA